MIINLNLRKALEEFKHLREEFCSKIASLENLGVLKYQYNEDFEIDSYNAALSTGVTENIQTVTTVLWIFLASDVRYLREPERCVSIRPIQDVRQRLSMVRNWRFDEFKKSIEDRNISTELNEVMDAYKYHWLVENGHCSLDIVAPPFARVYIDRLAQQVAYTLEGINYHPFYNPDIESCSTDEYLMKCAKQALEEFYNMKHFLSKNGLQHEHNRCVQGMLKGFHLYDQVGGPIYCDDESNPVAGCFKELSNEWVSSALNRGERNERIQFLRINCPSLMNW